jgi:hypothetical protein
VKLKGELATFQKQIRSVETGFQSSAKKYQVLTLIKTLFLHHYGIHCLFFFFLSFTLSLGSSHAKNPFSRNMKNL